MPQSRLRAVNSIGMLRAWISAVRRHGHSVSSSRPDTAVLLLHGLTGTPVDMHYMRDALVTDGYTVSVPLREGLERTVAWLRDRV